MLLAEDAPEKRRSTELFFDWLKLTPDKLFVSKLVEDEIAACPQPKRTRIITALQGLPIAVMPLPAGCSSLADEYIKAGIIPGRYKNDALHAAVAVWHDLDVIVSWNMTHLVNVRKVEQINAVNRRLGYPVIRIHTPEEVWDL